MYVETYPITRAIRSTEPTTVQEPVTLAQVKRQCKIPPEIGDHDEQLTRILVSARQQVEVDCALVCYTGTFTWKLTDFPCHDFLELPDIRPVTSITSITYTDSSGSSTTLSASVYGLENGTVTPYVKLTYGNVWPSTRGDINGITVTFVAGYASVSVVPENVRQAVLLQANIQWNDSLEIDTQKMREAYVNHCERIRRRVYA